MWPDQGILPEQFGIAAGPVQENWNESAAVLNEEVPSQQSQNQDLNVSDEEPTGQSVPQPSQELFRMPAQRNTDRITTVQCYKMNYKNRGLCVIFSHQMFKMNASHESIATETTTIKNTFEKKGFRMLLCVDFSYNKIEKQLKELSLVNDDDDCIRICVSTHGQKGLLYARDYAYSIDIFEDTLIKIKKLIGKPKLIIIQACRGSNLDRAVSLNDVGSDSDEQNDKAVNSTRHPSRADVLIVHSTPYGSVSWRYWFFDALCKILQRYGEEDNIDEILRKTARKMSEMESLCPDNMSRAGAKQIPVVYSLTKRLFLKRK